MWRCRLLFDCGTYALALLCPGKNRNWCCSSQNIACKFTYYNLIVYFEIGDDVKRCSWLTRAKPWQTYRIAIWLCDALKTKQHIFEKGRREFIVCICLGQRAQTNKSNVWKWHLLLFYRTSKKKGKKTTTKTTAAAIRYNTIRCVLPFVCWVSIELRKCYQIEKTCQIVIRFDWHCFD